MSIYNKTLMIIAVITLTGIVFGCDMDILTTETTISVIVSDVYIAGIQVPSQQDMHMENVIGAYFFFGVIGALAAAEEESKRKTPVVIFGCRFDVHIDGEVIGFQINGESSSAHRCLTLRAGDSVDINRYAYRTKNSYSWLGFTSTVRAVED